ncbi:MAG TPA: glycosyltransferase family 87 protein [Vicinamibacterales bacterium]|nr:glycosyltransferase family 87 protein [Vicinamibacterales bacterium]
MRNWVAATAALVLLVASSSGIIPWRDAVGGAFRPPDFAQDIAAARILDANGDPYAANFAATHAQVLGIASTDGYPYLPHPPLVIAVSWPFARVTFGAAALCWFAASLACAFVLAIVLIGLARSHTGFHLPQLRDALLCFAGLLLWPPVLYNLEKGQFSILIAMLIALGWVCLSRRGCRAAGICMGLAAALKLFPALLGLYLLIRHRRSAMWFVGTGIVTTTLPLLWLGWRAVPEFIAQTAGNLSYWQTWPAVTYSLRGLAARLLIGSDWSIAVMHAPSAASAVVVVSSVVLIGIAVHATLKLAKRQDSDDLLFAIWSVLLLPLNPLAMGHNGVLLGLPIVLIGRALATDPSTLVRVLWGAGCVLVSIPRQAVFEAAPIPVTPFGSIAIVALPLWGTLLLLAAGVAIAHRRHEPALTHFQTAAPATRGSAISRVEDGPENNW